MLSVCWRRRALSSRVSSRPEWTITGGSGYAIQVTGGAANIRNSGLIAGRVSLTDNDDTVVNTGTFRATGTSDFGAGDDVFTNHGSLVIPAGNAVRSVKFSNLETFNNSGLIDLRNGQVGDTLTLDGTAYTGSGNSTLGLDVGTSNAGVTDSNCASG